VDGRPAARSAKAGDAQTGDPMKARRVGVAAIVLVAALAAGARSNAQEATGAAHEGEIVTAPVVFDDVVLFRVRGVSSFPADTRARAIADRLMAVAADSSVSVASMRVAEIEGIRRILAGDRLIVSITTADASLEQASVDDLASATLMRLRQAVTDYREARSPAALKRGAVRALAATLGLVISLGLLAWFWRWLDQVAQRRLYARIQSVGVQSLELMRAERIWQAMRSALLAIRTVAYLALALMYLGLVLAQFPWTRGLSRDMASFALGPLQVIAQGIVTSIPSMVFLTVLYFVFRFALKMIRLVFDAVKRGTVKFENFEPEWAEPTYKILRVLVIAFGLIVAYPYIPGSQSEAFKGVSLFIGIVFSLGSSSAISNIIAGYMMTYRRAFKVGDRVKIGGSMGDVIETRLQVTHLRSVKNEEVIIPNSQILGGEVINYSSLARTKGLILHTEVGIGYETPWRQVEAMLFIAAERTPGLAKDPRPFVLVKALADFAVTYELNAYCHDVPSMMRVYTELHRHILDVFNEYGVQIMTPAYEGDPAEPKVVAPKDWYLAPAPPPETAAGGTPTPAPAGVPAAGSAPAER
jgi:small-conductance mechanosensitive channel